MGLEKLEFQTEMFEAMKKNMVKVMQYKFLVQFVEGKDPKVETYRKCKAEEQYILDLQFKENAVEHTVQVTIYNTNCTMGIDSVVNSAHVSIDKQSVAEYFVDTVIVEVADIIKEAVNIGKLNGHCRTLAICQRL